MTKPGYHADDPYPVRQVLSGFIPDILVAFGGIWDDVTLETARHFFVDAHYAGAGADGNGQLGCEIHSKSEEIGCLTLRLLDPDGHEVLFNAKELRFHKGQNRFDIPFHVDDPVLWDTQCPALYRYELTVTLGEQSQTLTRRFGFRTFCAQGDRLLLNGKPFYWRGLLNWGYNEDKLVPSYSDESVRDELKMCAPTALTP